MSEEIIINDVNVARCEHLTEINGCWLSTADYLPYKGNITNELCKYNDNCYYKQLQRLKQENEKLNVALEKSEQVKKLVAFDRNGNAYFVSENNKYKQALEEIREIAERQMRCCTCEFQNGEYKSGCRDCESRYAREMAVEVLSIITGVGC